MIIKVQLRKKHEDEYGGMEYSYRTDLPLRGGEIVIAPTARGLTYAKVTQVNVPEEEIDPRWRDGLREIYDFADISNEK